MASMKRKDVHLKFSELIMAKNAAMTLGLSCGVISQYRNRGASFAKQLEILFNAGHLRFKDIYDDNDDYDT